MTAVAKLLPCPFCGGEVARAHYPPHKHVFAPMPDYPGAWSVECDACEIRIFSHDSQEDADTRWSRRAAISPAELGGVEDYVDPLDVFLSQGVDDVPCLQVPGRVLARFVPGSWDSAYEMFSGNTPTPRAAEAVTEEMVDSVRADIMQAAANDGRLHIVLKDEWVRAALTAALTPPSAELPQKPGPTGHIPWSKEVG